MLGNFTEKWNEGWNTECNFTQLCLFIIITYFQNCQTVRISKTVNSSANEKTCTNASSPTPSSTKISSEQFRTSLRVCQQRLEKTGNSPKFTATSGQTATSPLSKFDSLSSTASTWISDPFEQRHSDGRHVVFQRFYRHVCWYSRRRLCDVDLCKKWRKNVFLFRWDHSNEWNEQKCFQKGICT